MVHILPAAPLGTTDQMSPIRAAVPSALTRVIDSLGDKRLDQLSRAKIAGLITELREGQHPLSPRSVNLTLGLLRQALNVAVRDGTLARNPAMLVERVYQPTTEMDAWTAAEAATFLEATRTHLWAGAFALSLSGLRRGEVLGARWRDINLDGDPPRITVRRSRVQLLSDGLRADGGVVDREDVLVA